MVANLTLQMPMSIGQEHVLIVKLFKGMNDLYQKYIKQNAHCPTRRKNEK